MLRDIVNMNRNRGDPFVPGSMDDSKDFFLELLHFLPDYQSMATFQTVLEKSCSRCGSKSVDLKEEEICPIFQDQPLSTRQIIAQKMDSGTVMQKCKQKDCFRNLS